MKSSAIKETSFPDAEIISRARRSDSCISLLANFILGNADSTLIASVYRLYRSLRAVKVLLAALCSTLTVLAPRSEVRIGSRWRSNCALTTRHRVSDTLLAMTVIPAMIVRSLQELPSDQADLLG